jgi:hypothetical protein
LEDQLPRLIDLLTPGLIIDALKGQAIVHVALCSHLRYIRLLDQAAWAQAFTKEFNSSK